MNEEIKNQTNQTTAPAPAPRMEGKVRTYIYSTAGIALIAVALRIAALFTGFEPEAGYFSASSLVYVISKVMLTVGVLWALTALWLIPGQPLPRQMSSGGKCSAFFASFAAGVFLCDVIFKIVALCRQKTSGELGAILAQFKNLRYYRTAPDRTARLTVILSFVAVAASLAAIVYFFLLSLPVKHKPGLSLAGMAVILRLLCGLAVIYFDMDLAMNSPNKIVLQIGMVCAMLFLLAEARFLLPVEYARPRSYIAAGLITMLVCFVGGVSCLTGYFAGPLHKFGYFGSEGFVCATLAFYCFARLVDYAKVVETGKVSFIDKIKEIIENSEDSEDSEDSEGGESAGNTESTGNVENSEKPAEDSDTASPAEENTANGAERK